MVKEKLLISIPKELKDFLRVASSNEGISMGQFIINSLNKTRKQYIKVNK